MVFALEKLFESLSVSFLPAFGHENHSEYPLYVTSTMLGVGGGSGPGGAFLGNKMWTGDEEHGNERSAGVLVEISKCRLMIVYSTQRLHLYQILVVYF